MDDDNIILNNIQLTPLIGGFQSSSFDPNELSNAMSLFNFNNPSIKPVSPTNLETQPNWEDDPFAQFDKEEKINLQEDDNKDYSDNNLLSSLIEPINYYPDNKIEMDYDVTEMDHSDFNDSFYSYIDSYSRITDSLPPQHDSLESDESLFFLNPSYDNTSPVGSLIVVMPPLTGRCDIYTHIGIEFQSKLGDKNLFLQIVDPRFTQNITYISLPPLATAYLTSILRNIAENQPIVLLAHSSGFSLALEIYNQYMANIDIKSEHELIVIGVDPTPKDFFLTGTDMLVSSLAEIVYDCLFSIKASGFSTERTKKIHSILNKIESRIYKKEWLGDFNEKLCKVLWEDIIEFCKTARFNLNKSIKLPQLMIIVSNFLALYEWSHQSSIKLDSNIRIFTAEASIKTYESTHIFDEQTYSKNEIMKNHFSLGWQFSDKQNDIAYVEVVKGANHQSIVGPAALTTPTNYLVRTVVNLDRAYLSKLSNNTTLDELYKERIKKRNKELKKLLVTEENKQRQKNSIQSLVEHNFSSPIYSRSCDKLPNTPFSAQQKNSTPSIPMSNEEGLIIDSVNHHKGPIPSSF